MHDFKLEQRDGQVVTLAHLDSGDIDFDTDPAVSMINEAATNNVLPDLPHGLLCGFLEEP